MKWLSARDVTDSLTHKCEFLIVYIHVNMITNVCKGKANEQNIAAIHIMLAALRLQRTCFLSHRCDLFPDAASWEQRHPGPSDRAERGKCWGRRWSESWRRSGAPWSFIYCAGEGNLILCWLVVVIVIAAMVPASQTGSRYARMWQFGIGLIFHVRHDRPDYHANAPAMNKIVQQFTVMSGCLSCAKHRVCVRSPMPALFHAMQLAFEQQQPVRYQLLSPEVAISSPNPTWSVGVTGEDQGPLRASTRLGGAGESPA